MSARSRHRRLSHIRVRVAITSAAYVLIISERGGAAVSDRNLSLSSALCSGGSADPSENMLTWFLLLCAQLMFGWIRASELTFELPDNAKQCFYEDITVGTKCTLEFQVTQHIGNMARYTERLVGYCMMIEIAQMALLELLAK